MSGASYSFDIRNIQDVRVRAVSGVIVETVHESVNDPVHFMITVATIDSLASLFT